MKNPKTRIEEPAKRQTGEPALSSSVVIRHSLLVTLLLLSTLHLPLFTASAQSYSIDWFTIDGGGGTSTGSVYAVSGTVGQADANPQPLSSGNFSVVGGFWSLFSVVQTPGAP